MRPDERESLRRRFRFRCGYCGVSERDAGSELTVDHFQPQSRGGEHEPANWVYSCHACNEFKGDFYEVDSPRRILHPINDDLSQYLRESEDGFLQAVNDTGAFHLARLRLNRPQLVTYRRERRALESALGQQRALFQHLEELERQVKLLTTELEQLKPK